MDNLIDFNRVLARLMGARVVKTYAGPNTGSNLSLTLVEEKSGSLDSTLRKHPQLLVAGEIALFVECAWRLQRRDTSLIGSGLCDVDVASYEVIAGMRNHVILHVTCAPATLDLTVVFDDDLQLQIFCDQFGDSSNYSVETESGTYAVSPPGRVVKYPPPILT